MKLENKQTANSQINTWKRREATVKINRKGSLDKLIWSTQNSNKQKKIPNIELNTPWNSSKTITGNGKFSLILAEWLLSNFMSGDATSSDETHTTPNMTIPSFSNPNKLHKIQFQTSWAAVRTPLTNASRRVVQIIIGSRETKDKTIKSSCLLARGLSLKYHF